LKFILMMVSVNILSLSRNDQQAYLISGKLLLEEKNKSSIEIEELNKGLYILTLSEESGYKVRRIKFLKL
jgi:hypothetical protein